MSKEKIDTTNNDLIKFKQELDEKLNQYGVEEAIQENELTFECNGESYKVRKPTFGDMNKVTKAQSKKYLELLNDKSYPLENQLKISLKERGIDIEELWDKHINLEKQKNQLLKDLGKDLAEGKADTVCKETRDKIFDLIEEQVEIIKQRGNYLQFSLEAQLNVYTYYYLTTLITEKLVDKKWVKVWAGFDELENDPNEELRNLAFQKTMLFRKHDFAQQG